MSCEPRTVTDIMRDLLSELQNREWIEVRESKGCNCCPDTWTTACTSCGAEVTGSHDAKGRWVASREHKPDCALAALIRETEAFLRIEEQLQEEREMQAVGT
jgi:hypothetical protein